MYILQESTHFTHFVAIYAYFYVTLGGSAQIITILHRGGLSDLLQYYIGRRRVYQDPQNVLRNIWTAPYRGTFLKKRNNTNLRVWSNDAKIYFNPIFFSHSNTASKSLRPSTRRGPEKIASICSKLLQNQSIRMIMMWGKRATICIRVWHLYGFWYERIYSCQENYMNKYPNIFVWNFLTQTNIRIHSYQSVQWASQSNIMHQFSPDLKVSPLTQDPPTWGRQNTLKQ